MSSLWLVSTTSFFNFSFLPKYTIYFAQGILYTLLLSIVAVALAVLPALGLALMRLSKNKVLKTLSGAYIALFRSTPLLVQLALIYYGLFGVAGIQLPSVYVLGYINLAQFVPGAVALALNSAAYVAEIFRGGILAVDKGQMEAARSLGLTQWQGMKFVVLPQAIKNILPALANEVITMVKESAICSTYGMMELMWGAKTVAATTYVTLGPYVLAAIIYFCVNFPASKAIEAIERRMRRGDNQYCTDPGGKPDQDLPQRRPRSGQLLSGDPEGRSGGYRRPLRLGQIHHAALPQPAGRAHRRRHLL